MNDFSYQENWFQRHWKWLVPVIILLSAIPVLQSTLGDAIKDYGTLYSNPSLYENALTKVRQHKKASDFLGDPIETLFLVEGEVRYFNDGNSVIMTIPIKGSKIKGRMDIEANKLDDNWVYSLIRVRTKKPKAQIDVLKNE